MDFEVEPADIDESDVPSGLSPRELAIFLARGKAGVIAGRHRNDEPPVLVLGADTVVALGPTLFAKAETPSEACDMLRRLAGTRQSVITGVAVAASDGGFTETDAAESVVEMKPMSDVQIEEYVASGQWRGKAGAYGLQDHDPQNDPFVRLMSGDFDNVVGLPVALATRLLKAAGLKP